MVDVLENAPIGDDGRYMTPKRVRMHRWFNAIMVLAVACIVAAVGFTIAAYFQGQTYEDLELIASGGTVFNGTSVASLMRIEAIFCFVGGVLLVATHLLGFVWFYERGGELPPRIASGIAAILSVAWIAYLVNLGTFDIIALVVLVAVALTWAFMHQVSVEAHEFDLSV